jgi:hypothetical protein
LSRVAVFTTVDVLYTKPARWVRADRWRTPFYILPPCH